MNEWIKINFKHRDLPVVARTPVRAYGYMHLNLNGVKWQ